jgi:hypothetical protein
VRPYFHMHLAAWAKSPLMVYCCYCYLEIQLRMDPPVHLLFQLLLELLLLLRVQCHPTVTASGPRHGWLCWVSAPIATANVAAVRRTLHMLHIVAC